MTSPSIPTKSRVEAEHPAIQNLRTCQRQLDMDGCEVGVSRQALDETLALLDDLLAAAQRLMHHEIGHVGPYAGQASITMRAAIAKATGQ